MLAQKEKQRTNRAALFARLGDDMDASKLRSEKLRFKDQDAEPEGDPLKQYREMLISGFVCKEWTKGKSASRKLSVNADWTSLLARDTSKGAAIQTCLPLNSLCMAQLGYGKGHMVKRFISKKIMPASKEDRCFVIKNISGDDILCAEAKSNGDAVKITSAIEALLVVSNKWPHRLNKG